MKKWAILAIAAILAAAIGWVVLELRAGARLAVQVEQLKADLAAERAAAELRDRINQAEAERLAAEQQDRLTFGSLQNEANSDPDAPSPGLGVRSVTRLNQIR